MITSFMITSFKVSSRGFTSSSLIRANYGFIGLGQMGQHMARHIYEKLDLSDQLYVYDVSASAADKFVQEVTAKKPEHLSSLTKLTSISQFVSIDKPFDFIITMVPEGKHVKAVIEELVTLYEKSSSDHATTFLDSSTIDIPTSRDIHTFVRSKLATFDFIDTPVSGGVAGARKATLSFMLSRDDDDAITPSLRKLLDKMGKNIFPCGAKHGSGLAAKLSNNYLLGITNLATADSFQLAKSFGLDLKKYAKLVAVSTGKSWASVDNCPIPGVYPENNLPSDVDYDGGFITKLTRKDLVLATECAKQNQRFLYLGDIGRFWYDKACEHPDIANKDLAVLFKWLGTIDENSGNQILDQKK